MVKSINKITLKQETFAKQSFASLRLIGKFAKFWNHEIHDLVAFAKVNSREHVQFLGPNSYFSRKILFFSKSL